MKREKFGSRLGFILISAGCAIGLGNVWRFPYITGQYGGAAFVLIYLLCLVLLGNYTGLLGGTGDEIHVAKVAEQAGQWDLEMNLGQAGSSEEEEEARDGISVQEVPSAKFLPQGLWEADTSYVEGREVKIGRDPDQSCWYAAWESEDVYYFAEGEDMSQEEFVEELKKIWKSL